MSKGRWMGYFAVLTVVAGLAACGDYTASTSPPQKKSSLSAPVGARHSRYILISGAWTCVEDCDVGEPKVEGFRPDPDSSIVDSLPPDTP